VGDYRSWKFSNEAHVQSGALTAGFASAAIEMICDPNNGYNLVGHQFVLVSKKQSVDDATQAIRDLSRSIQRTFDELNGPTGDASGSSQTKLDRFSETWRVAAERLGDELDGSTVRHLSPNRAALSMIRDS
ncbi:MAG TPA: hypothetical protein VIT23_16280, partial [Terrimicrobiaceae bacterium]